MYKVSRHDGRLASRILEQPGAHPLVDLEDVRGQELMVRRRARQRLPFVVEPLAKVAFGLDARLVREAALAHVA